VQGATMATMDLEQLLGALRARAVGGRLPHVLVVDDDEAVRQTLMDVLEQQGFAVAGAIHGADGLAQVRQRRPDLVVLDVMMPVMDGPAFLAVLRADASLANIPVVVMRDGRYVLEGGDTNQPPAPAAPGVGVAPPRRPVGPTCGALALAPSDEDSDDLSDAHHSTVKR